MMTLVEAIEWLKTDGRYDHEGLCCPKSSKAIDKVLDAVRNGDLMIKEQENE